MTKSTDTEKGKTSAEDSERSEAVPASTPAEVATAPVAPEVAPVAPEVAPVSAPQVPRLNATAIRTAARKSGAAPGVPVYDADDFTPAFDKTAHDVLAAEQYGSDDYNGYTEAQLRAMLSKNASIPEGISYSPNSRYPFAALTRQHHEDSLKSQREVDATLFGAPSPTTFATAAPVGDTVTSNGNAQSGTVSGTNA